MIITKLSVQKRDEQRINIFVDEKYAFSLTLQQVADEGLKKGATIDEAQLARLKRASSYGKLYARALARAVSRPQSIHDMRLYVRRVGRQRYTDLDESAYEAMLEKLQQLRYLDDARFAEVWAEMRTRGKRSVKNIQFELKQKGVSEDIIAEVLQEADDRANLRALIEKKRTKYDTTDKLIRYLAGKGFRFDDIQAVLGEEA